MTTKLTLQSALSRNTVSIKSGTQKNMPKSEKIERHQFVQLWTVTNHDIKRFSQNVWKSSLIVNTILKVKTDFDIIFIQELP